MLNMLYMREKFDDLKASAWNVLLLYNASVCRCFVCERIDVLRSARQLFFSSSSVLVT